MNGALMRHVHRRRHALTRVLALVGCLAAVGCTQTDDGTSTAVAAKAATPSAESGFQGWKPRLVDATPRGAAAESGAAEPKMEHAPVSITTDADPDSGGAPLTVDFVAAVNGGPPGLRYRWDFGDQSVPANQLSVQHTYETPGQYVATFTVTGPGVDESQRLQIEATEDGFDLDIEADPDIGNAPLTVRFAAVLDVDLPGPLQYQWNFGDGGQGVNSPTAHTYAAPGEYTATLTVTNGRGQSATRDVTVQVDAPEVP
jgi:PKD repeat protein